MKWCCSWKAALDSLCCRSSLAETRQWPCPISVLHRGQTGDLGRAVAAPGLKWRRKITKMTPVFVSQQPARLEDELWYPLPAQKCRLQTNPPLAVVKPPSSSVLQCQCASSHGRMGVWVRRTELGQLSSANKLTCLDFQGCFVANLSTCELTKTRAELNFRLTEHPQLEPAQREDEVLAVSGRKVLSSHWEFQEWEIYFCGLSLQLWLYLFSVRARLRRFCNTTVHGAAPAPESPQTKYSCDVCRLLAIADQRAPCSQGTCQDWCSPGANQHSSN